jgi:hypothetical protein
MRTGQGLEHELVDGQKTVGHRDRLLVRDLVSIYVFVEATYVFVEATEFFETLR